MGFNKSLFAGMLLSSILFIAFSAAIFDLDFYHGVTVPEGYVDLFNNTNSQRELYADTQEITAGGKINPDGFGDAVYKNVIVAGKRLQQSGSLFIAFLVNTTKIIPIDPQIIAVIITFVLFLATIGFLTSITKKSP